jgi:hypothetical protein
MVSVSPECLCILFILPTILSSTLQSALTFTVTSQHAVPSLRSGCRLLRQVPLGLAEHALPPKRRKAGVPADFLRQKSLYFTIMLNMCVKCSLSGCMKFRQAFLWWLLFLRSSEGWRWKFSEGDGEITMPQGSECYYLHPVKNTSVLPNIGSFTSSLVLLSVCQGFGSCLEGCVLTWQITCGTLDSCSPAEYRIDYHSKWRFLSTVMPVWCVANSSRICVSESRWISDWETAVVFEQLNSEYNFW